MARPKKAAHVTLPDQFWAVRWKGAIYGPFTSLERAQDWAEDHYRDQTEVYNMYAPLWDEPDKGHEIGTVYAMGALD